jgi:hypothetical protein
MKSQKPYIPTDNSENEENIVCEPAVVYGYANQTNYEPAILENPNEVTPRPQKILQPDDDLRRAITAEELVKRIHADIRRKFASRS